MLKTKGLIHVIFGSGVGKTTSAVGIALQAAGQGMKIQFVQFMKSGVSGEVNVFNRIPDIDYFCPGPHPFIEAGGPQPVHVDHARVAFSRAMDSTDQNPDLLICDELLNALLFKLLPLDQVFELMGRCRGRIGLVMTGRQAPPEIIAVADHVTELVERKHPYTRGVLPRLGIEF